MNVELKHILNKSVRIVVAAFGRPELLVVESEYRAVRASILADPRPFVAPIMKRKPVNARIFDCAMWFQRHGPAERRQAFQLEGEAAVSLATRWYSELVAPAFQGLIAALEGRSQSVYVRVPSTLGNVSPLVANDLGAFFRIFLRALNEPWIFENERTVKRALAEVRAMLDEPPALGREPLSAAGPSIWLGRFIEEHATTGPYRCAFTPPDHFVLSNGEPGVRWTTSGDRAPSGAPEAALEHWDAAVAAARSSVAYYHAGFAKDVPPRIRNFLQSMHGG